MGAARPFRPHVYMCSSAQSQSGWEGNNTERKTGSGLCFPSFGPPPPPPPPCPFLTVIALCAFSSLTLIVLSVEVKVVLTYLCCISNKPQRSPESSIETKQNACFFHFFFVGCHFFFFFLWLELDSLWQLCSTSHRESGLFFPFFSPRRDLGPDAKANTDLNSAPPLLILHWAQTALWFLPRGWYRALLRNAAHLTPSDNPARAGLP